MSRLIKELKRTSALLEERVTFIISLLCLYLDPREMYKSIAIILEKEEVCNTTATH